MIFEYSKRLAASRSGANSGGSSTEPETTLDTALAIPVPYCPLVNDNVLYHAQNRPAGKGYFEGFRGTRAAAVTVTAAMAPYS